MCNWLSVLGGGGIEKTTFASSPVTKYVIVQKYSRRSGIRAHDTIRAAKFRRQFQALRNKSWNFMPFFGDFLNKTVAAAVANIELCHINFLGGLNIRYKHYPLQVGLWRGIFSLAKEKKKKTWNIDHLICGESYIFWVLRNSSSVHSVTVTQSCDTLFLTASSLSSHQQLHLPSSSTLTMSKLILFRLSLCQFSDVAPWLPRVVFWLSLERLWPPLTRSSLPPGHHENHLILACSKIPLSVFLGLSTNIICCTLLYILHSNLFQFTFFVQWNPLVQMFAQLTFSSTVLFNHCSIIIWLLFDYCSTSDPGNVFQVFRPHKEVTITYNLGSINIELNIRLTHFRLSIVWHEGLLPP